jgi:hypothetical protein
VYVLQASQQPVADLPNPLVNALVSFVASVDEPAVVQVRDSGCWGGGGVGRGGRERHSVT